MPTIRLNVTSENRASAEILQLRRQLNDLNAQVASNNARAVEATEEQRRGIREQNRRIRSEAGLLRVQQQRSSISLSALRMESGLLAQTRRQTELLTSITRGFGTALGALGIASVTAQLADFTAGTVRAGVRVEGFTNAFSALGLGAEGAARRIEELQELSRLPGIRFEQATQAAIRLRVIGIEGERANGVIRELGNALAITGDTDLSGAIRSITQIVQLQRVNQEEINQLVERSGAAAQALQDAFGTTRAESIQANLEANGQSVQDFVDILVNSLSKQARVSADSTANAFSNLANATFELQAAIGERLNPIIGDATRGLTGLFEVVTDFISGTNDATRSVESYANALTNASNVAGVAEGIRARIAFLQSEKDALDAAAAASANFLSFRGRQTEAGADYEDIRDELALLQAALTQTGVSVEGLDAIIDIQRQNYLNALSESVAAQEAYDNENARFRSDERQRLEAAREALGRESDALDATLAAKRRLTQATDEATEATNQETESTKELTAEVQRLTDIYAGLTRNVQEYAQFLELINSTGASDFFRLARGEIGGYSASIQTIIPSIVNITNEQDALTAVFNEQSVAINENRVALDEETQALLRYLATLDALDESLANVERRLDAHNAALVNPAVSEAVDSMRSYIDVIDDVQTEFQTVESISDMVTAAIREQGSAFDDLRDATGAVEPTLDDVADALEDIQAESDLITFDDWLNELDQIAPALEGLEGTVVPVLDSISGGLSDIREGARVDEAFVGVGLNIGEHLLPGFEIATAFLGTMMEIDNLLNTVNFQEGAIEGVNRAQGFQLPGESDAAFQRRQERLRELGVFDEADAPSRLGTGRTREGDPILDPLSDSVLPGRRRRGTDAGRQGFRPPGTRYNATTGQFEPIPTIFSEDASGGSGLGAPQESADERVGIEEETQARILAIQERAIEDRASNEQRLQDDIRGIADSVVAFHERTERRKVEISERATEDRQRIEQRLQDDIRGIADDVVAFHTRTQEQITAVQERATADRLRVEDTYNQDVQQIADDVVAFHTRTQEQITAVTERAAADRLRVEDTYNQDVQQIADDVVAFHTRTQEQITAVTERAAADRITIEDRYSDEVQGIYDDVADRYGDAEAEKVAITERAAADRASAEESYADTVQGIVNGLVDSVRSVQDQIIDAEMQAVQDRISAQMDYNDEVQGIYNNLASEIMSIEERLNDELDRIGEQRIASEQSRLESIARLNSESRASISGEDTDIRRGIEDALSDAFGIEVDQLGARGFSVENLLSQLTDSTGLIQSQRFGDLFRGGAFSGLGNLGDDAFSDLESQIADLLLERNRNIEDIELMAARERIRIQEQAAAEQAALTTQEGTAITGAAMATGAAEAAAGTTAAEALMNAVPPLDAMSMASMNLATTLTTIDENLATDVGAFNDAITNLETDAGISFENALMQYTPSLSAMAEAGQTFADTISGINTQELADLANVDTNFAAFVQAAGVTLPDALTNASPPMTRLAIAMESLDVGIAGVNESEIDDITALTTGFDNFVAMAGIPLTEALNLASPPMTRLATAIESRDTGLLGIDDQESADIMALTTGFDNFVAMAGIPLTEALNLASPPMTRLATAIETMQTGLLGIDDQESADIMALTTGFDNFVAMAGIPLTEAMTLATPAMTLLAQAIGRSETGIAGVDEAEMTALAAEDTRFSDFVQAAGIDLPNALELATPTMSRHAAALEGFNQRAFGIDTQESTDLSALGVLPGSVPPSAALTLSDSPRLAEAMATPQAPPSLQAMEIVLANVSRSSPLPVEMVGGVEVKGPVAIDGTVPITTAEPIQAFVVNFPEGGQTTVIQFPSGAAYEVANQINLGIQAGEVVGF